MSILTWEKPKQVLSKEEWKNSIGFDGGPYGGYESNMSIEDRQLWKAKLIKGKFPRVEIRKTTTNGVQILIVVSNNGFPRSGSLERGSKEKNIKISQNGASFFSLEEFEQLNLAIKEAFEELTLTKEK